MFENGYALLIGVDRNRVGKLALPVVGKDVNKLAEVIVHPERCAYLQDSVRTITKEDATRDNILGGLDWLEDKLEQDDSDNETAIIYFSGHGHQTESGENFLIPYDLRFPINLYALPAIALAERIASIKPRRLLVVLDCCHAEGMGIKGDIDSESIAPMPITPNSPGFSELAKGDGRAVFSSSRGDEKSWIRQDGEMSIFTYHFVNALMGHAGRVDASDVRVTEVMDYVAKSVPDTAKAEGRPTQTPVFEFKGTAFPIAQIMGGKELVKGEELPDALESLPPILKSDLEIELVEEGAEATTLRVGKFRRGEAHVTTKIGVNKGKVTSTEIDEFG